MIPSARFGDVILNNGYDNYVTCNLYSLYEGGIESVAGNKEFCLYLLADTYQKLSMHGHQAMSFDGGLTREQAESLFNSLDETSHLFYKECLALLKGTLNAENGDEITILNNKTKFKFFADKVIKDFSVSEIEPMEDTFQEYAILEFKVANLKLIDHITNGLLVEC